MGLRIVRTQRDALYDCLVAELSVIGDIHQNLRHDDPARAKELRSRCEAEMQLLDDLGWEKEPDTSLFELTMPASLLRPLIERIYSSAVGLLADDEGQRESDETQTSYLRTATMVCPDILSRLALAERTATP